VGADNSGYYIDRGVPGKDTRRYPVAPFEIGHVPSNRENLRTRYRLIPYYYSLARRAAETGAPLFPPPGMLYADRELRGIAH
jgi:alpha-glucosidase